jgi:hypothetical protein
MGLKKRDQGKSGFHISCVHGCPSPNAHGAGLCTHSKEHKVLGSNVGEDGKSDPSGIQEHLSRPSNGHCREEIGAFTIFRDDIRDIGQGLHSFGLKLEEKIGETTFFG